MNQPTTRLNDGNTIPQLGLGVWKANDGEEVERAVKMAIEGGYRLIDTAMVYQNEIGVGNGIRASGIAREDLFITTKLWNSDQGAGNVRPALEASLDRLGLEYIDLYLIHWPMPAKDLYIETWREFEELQKDGLVKSIGVCNFEIKQLERLKDSGLSTPVVNQIELHPGLNQLELREYATANSIVIESWSPLGQGGELLNHPVLLAIAEKHAKTAAQIILRWHLQHELIVIPKSVTPERISQNFDVFDFQLVAEEMEEIDRIDSIGRIGPDPAGMNIS